MTEHDDILVALRRITRAIDLQSRWLLKETGLTAPQLVILRTLARDGQMSPSMLARTISLSQATVTLILDKLTRAELVARERSGSDKRVVLMRLTEAGQRVINAAPELLQSGFLREFRKLEEWEQHMLIASLQRIAELMDASDIDASPFLQSGEMSQPAEPE